MYELRPIKFRFSRDAEEYQIVGSFLTEEETKRYIKSHIRSQIEFDSYGDYGNGGLPEYRIRCERIVPVKPVQPQPTDAVLGSDFNQSTEY